ncbi:MAG: ribosomal RNA small subunit methyltransferase A [Terriglobales bacterium]
MKAPKGQNFLYQPAWLGRVAAAVGPSQDLLEIGGGPGALSLLLAAQSVRFWVVESDPRLAQSLRQLGLPTLETDILALDLGALAAEQAVARWRIAGNLPYHITSPILLHLFRFAACIADATIMVQREVADRLLARPGSRTFGLLSATAQFYAHPVRLFDLPPGAFRPAPQVHSTLLRLTFASRAAELGVDEPAFMAFLRLAFRHKRKRLSAVGIPSPARAEQLSLEQLAELHRQSLLPPAGG